MSAHQAMYPIRTMALRPVWAVGDVADRLRRQGFRNLLIRMKPPLLFGLARFKNLP